MIEPTYNDKIYKALLDLKQGEDFVIADSVTPENRKAVVELIKDIIHRDDFRGFGKQVEFSSDYTKCRTIIHPLAAEPQSEKLKRYFTKKTK